MSAPAPHLHGRQRRRRQEHADRTAAVRLAVGLRGPGRSRSSGRRRTARPAPIDFSLFTDGLQAPSASRASRSTSPTGTSRPARRKFILADTPGHEQYTRNMATGASTADVAILLVDAQQGVLPQSRRHARIAQPARHHATSSWPSTRWIWSASIGTVFERIAADFADAAARRARCYPIPVSALHGDNVIAASDRTPWFDGPSLLEYLETVEVPRQRRGRAAPAASPDRDPARPHLPRLRRPDPVRHGARRRHHHGVAVGPASRVKRIVTWDGDLDGRLRADVGRRCSWKTSSTSAAATSSSTATSRWAAGSRRTWSGWTNGRSSPTRALPAQARVRAR